MLHFAVKMLIQTEQQLPSSETRPDMTLLYYDAKFLKHDTGAHPERPERLRQIIARLEQTGVAANCDRPIGARVA